MSYCVQAIVLYRSLSRPRVTYFVLLICATKLSRVAMYSIVTACKDYGFSLNVFILIDSL